MSSLAHHAADPFRLLVESVVDYAIYMVDPAGLIATWNPASERIYGYRADEIIGRSFELVVVPEEIAEADAVRQRALVEGHVDFEGLRVRKDGSRFWAVVSVSNLKDYFGNHAGFSVVTRDITERKKAEEAVRTERDLSAAMLASLPGVYYMYDESGRFLRWNRLFEEVTEYSAEEIATLHPLDLFSGADKPRVAERIETVFRDGHAEVEAEFISKSGRQTPYFFTGVRAVIAGQPCLLGMGIDLSAQKRAHQELQRTGDLLRAVAEATTDAIFVKDTESRYMLLNPAAAQFVGKDVTEILGLDDTALFDAHDARSVIEHDRRVMDANLVETAEERLTAAGVTRTYLTTKAPYRDGAGNIIGVVGIARDISDRKRVEERLEQNRALLRMASRVGRMGAWSVDLATLHVAWSDELLAILELPADLSPDFEYGINIYLPQYRQQVRDAFNRCVGDEVPFDLEVQCTTASGRILWIRIMGEAIRTPDGVVTGACGAFQDISDRKDAAEVLQLRDRAIQAVSQGILITDALKEDNPIIFASSGFERLTGYHAAEVLGRNSTLLRGPESDRESADQIDAAVTTGAGCLVEILNYRKDGSPFRNQLTLSPVLGADGHLTHFVEVHTDVTELRRLEEQFRQAQKMEAVGQLAGGVAHDFNNMLTVIQGYTELALASITPNDPLRELLAEIYKAGERAGALTRQLLAFSRQQVLAPRVLNLNDVVLDTEKMLRRLIGEDIILVTKLSPTLGQVRADPGQIEQVLMNLVVNARDAMPTGGSLTIETQLVRLDESYCRPYPDLTPDDYVMLAVSDSGTGMDEATRARIFEPFFTTKGHGQGTGLGLATVHGILKQSRGHVSVYSEVGRGSTFKVYLPQVSDATSRARADVTSLVIPAGNETVLLVEDDEAVRSLATLVLRRCGYRLLVAANGTDAIRLAREEESIDLLLSDVVMPHLGGRELAEQILAMHPQCIPLFMSGYTDDAVIRHGILEADFAFLQKPFTPASLAQKVRSVLDLAPGRTP